MFLEIDRIAAAYGATPVLDGISLTVEKGGLVDRPARRVWLRENDAAARAVGLSSGRWRTGSAEWDGYYRPAAGKARYRPGFQSYALWPHMTVAQNVGYGLTLRKRPKAEIAEKVMEALTASVSTGLPSAW